MKEKVSSQMELVSSQKPPKAIKSEELFGGCREVVIQHKDVRYRLMITKAGKLILNK